MTIKKLIKKITLRLLITTLISVAILFFGWKTMDFEARKSSVSGLIIGISIFSYMPIYDYDIWSVKKKIIIHTILMFFSVYPALITSGWFDNTSGNKYLIALVSFLSFGIVFATIGYLVSKYVFKNVPEGK